MGKPCSSTLRARRQTRMRQTPHRLVFAAETLMAHRCRPRPLSASSPDLDRIEIAFSTLKTHLRRIGARTVDAVIAAPGEVCPRFSPEEPRTTSHIEDTLQIECKPLQSRPPIFAKIRS